MINGSVTGIEVKSAMTYNSAFENNIRHLEEWMDLPVRKKAIVYTGTYENTAGNIQLLPYLQLSNLF